nr:hypothetical protein [Tanacetum cinerariifolium]
ISPALTQKVFANMRRVRKGFSGVETPLFKGMLVIQENVVEAIADEQVQDDVTVTTAPEAVTTVVKEDIQAQLIPSPAPPTLPSPPQDIPSTSHEALDACAALTRRVEHLEHDKVAQDLDIIKLKIRVKKLERANKGRMIDELDRDEGIKLMGEKDEKKKDIANDDQAERRHAEIQAEKQADISNRHRSCCKSFDAPVNAASTIILAAELNIPAVTITAAIVKVAVASTRRRRGVVIRDPEEESTTITPAETKNKGKGKSYDDIRLIFEAKFNINMKFLLKSKEQIEEENRALEIINETPAQKAAKRRREDLETLWSIVKKRFSTSKSNYFSDEYLLTTLRTMFGRPDGQDNVWKS